MVARKPANSCNQSLRSGDKEIRTHGASDSRLGSLLIVVAPSGTA
jgi:hypothetical protein